MPEEGGRRSGPRHFGNQESSGEFRVIFPNQCEGREAAPGKRDEERKNEREEYRRWENEKRKEEDRKRRTEEESQNSKRLKTMSNKENTGSPRIKSVLGKFTSENKKHK